MNPERVVEHGLAFNPALPGVSSLVHFGVGSSFILLYNCVAQASLLRLYFFQKLVTIKKTLILHSSWQLKILEQFQIRFVAVSPTIPNAQDIAEWLGKK